MKKSIIQILLSKKKKNKPKIITNIKILFFILISITFLEFICHKLLIKISFIHNIFFSK